MAVGQPPLINLNGLVTKSRYGPQRAVVRRGKPSSSGNLRLWFSSRGEPTPGVTPSAAVNR